VFCTLVISSIMNCFLTNDLAGPKRVGEWNKLVYLEFIVLSTVLISISYSY
jgi:hypothetical protein